MNDYIKLALSEIPLYFMNLMELFVSPKQFLSGKCTDDADAINGTKSKKAPRLALR